jgi:hypothetical protein
MFGDATEIKINIPYPKKSATVRLPSPVELTAFYDDASKTKDTEDRTPYVTLFNKIRSDQGESFDEYESAFSIDNLLSYTVTSTTKDGDEYTVSIKTPFGPVVHKLRPLTMKEMVIYTKDAMNRNASTSRNASVKLYDSLVQTTDGYKSSEDIPVYHKVPVMTEVYLAHLKIDPIQIDPNA